MDRGLVTVVVGIEVMIEYTSIASINHASATPDALFGKRLDFSSVPAQVGSEAKEEEGKR